MKISVIIPTFRRPSYLLTALRALAAQQRLPDQIVLGLRQGDEETEAMLRDRVAEIPSVEIALVEVPGVVASMQAALGRTSGDIVCLLDDDAEPLLDWIGKIAARFSADGRLGMVGGRDLLRDHPEMRAAEPTTGQVGIFTWSGRFLGNHHRGGGSFRRVDTLKGCNAAVRGDLLRRLGFEQGLRGAGAQVHWEIALCLDVAAAGFDVAYDPEIRVIHHIAPRYDLDQGHRGIFSPEGLYDMVWNEHFVVSNRMSPVNSFRHFLHSVVVGCSAAPGAAQFLRLLLRRDPHRNERIAITWKAIRDGRRAGSHARA